MRTCPLCHSTPRLIYGWTTSKRRCSRWTALGQLAGICQAGFKSANFSASRTVHAAWRQVESWLTCENVWIPSPTDRHVTILGKIVASQSLKADLVPDAHLAALAMEHGLKLYSTDGDFARFSGLDWINPLIGH